MATKLEGGKALVNNFFLRLPQPKYYGISRFCIIMWLCGSVDNLKALFRNKWNVKNYMIPITTPKKIQSL